MRGNGGDDRLIGGNQSDTLSGGVGEDIFKYVKLSEGGDTITDFTGSGVAGGDRIDLALIDATPGGVNNAFVFGGTTATAHGVWYAVAGGKATVFADIDGNAATAEMRLFLTGVSSLIQSDFIL